MRLLLSGLRCVQPALHAQFAMRADVPPHAGHAGHGIGAGSGPPSPHRARRGTPGMPGTSAALPTSAPFEYRTWRVGASVEGPLGIKAAPGEQKVSKSVSEWLVHEYYHELPRLYATEFRDAGT